MSSKPSPMPLSGEVLSDRLMLFGTIIGLMADHPETFGKQEYYGLQEIMYLTAREVFPNEEREE